MELVSFVAELFALAAAFMLDVQASREQLGMPSSSGRMIYKQQKLGVVLRSTGIPNGWFLTSLTFVCHVKWVGSNIFLSYR
jgi:hypothetical protein